MIISIWVQNLNSNEKSLHLLALEIETLEKSKEKRMKNV
jgi:hypothetical protein